MTALAESRQVDHNISKALEAALARGALPGESEGFDQKAMLTAAAFIAGTAATRRPGHVAIALETLGEGATGRYMRIAIVNDDMPFLRSEEHTSELQSLMRISYDVFCLKK